MEPTRRTMLQFFASTLALPSWLGMNVEEASAAPAIVVPLCPTMPDVVPEMDEDTLRAYALNLVQAMDRHSRNRCALDQHGIFNHWQRLREACDRPGAIGFLYQYTLAVLNAAGIRVDPRLAEHGITCNRWIFRRPGGDVTLDAEQTCTVRFTKDVDEVTSENILAEMIWAPVSDLVAYIRNASSIRDAPLDEHMPLCISEVECYFRIEAFDIEWFAYIRHFPRHSGYSGTDYYQMYPVTEAKDYDTFMHNFWTFRSMHPSPNRRRAEMIHVHSDQRGTEHIGNLVYEHLRASGDGLLKLFPDKWEAINAFFLTRNASLFSHGPGGNWPSDQCAFEFQMEGFRLTPQT